MNLKTSHILYISASLKGTCYAHSWIHVFSVELAGQNNPHLSHSEPFVWSEMFSDWLSVANRSFQQQVGDHVRDYVCFH